MAEPFPPGQPPYRVVVETGRNGQETVPIAFPGRDEAVALFENPNLADNLPYFTVARLYERDTAGTYRLLATRTRVITDTTDWATGSEG